MRAFICRTPDVDAEGVEQLLVLLNSKPGPIRFEDAGVVAAKSDLGDYGLTLFRKVAFAAMVGVRRAQELDDEDAVVLLTSLSDEKNYFAYGEPAGTGPGHHCIMISGWEDMAAMDFLYPTLHIVASNLLQGRMYKTMEEWERHSHQEPVGCLSDFCWDKQDILLRLRTADVCEACAGKFNAAIEEGKLAEEEFEQCMELLELAREGIRFHNRMIATPKPSPLLIDPTNLSVTLVSHNRVINFNGVIPHCLYILYLKHPEGIPYHELEQHIEALIDHYDKIKGTKTREKLLQSFGVLTAHHERSRLNQEVSKLRRSVKEAVGEKLLPLYMWDAGREAPKVIPIAGQPGMVIWEE
jgi:hypothetical protein